MYTWECLTRTGLGLANLARARLCEGCTPDKLSSKAEPGWISPGLFGRPDLGLPAGGGGTGAMLAASFLKLKPDSSDEVSQELMLKHAETFPVQASYAPRLPLPSDPRSSAGFSFSRLQVVDPYDTRDKHVCKHVCDAEAQVHAIINLSKAQKSSSKKDREREGNTKLGFCQNVMSQDSI